jgi:hypothetical protein
VPGLSIAIVGATSEGLENAVVLPEGALVIDHLNVRAWPSMSVDPEPSRTTVLPTGAV